MADSQELTTKLGAGGRIVIPARFRTDLSLRPGDTLILKMENGALMLTSHTEVVRRARALVRRYIPPGKSLVEELIRERREEAARE